MNAAFNADTLTSLALALGLGLLIGIERERSKGSGPTRRFAGIRTFALACLTGAGVQLLGQAWLTAVAGALVAGLALVSHFKDRSHDPGVTTEIALFLTLLLGMLSVPEPALAAALGVTVAVLLVARVPLQRFSTQVLSEQELRDALLLAASALVVLPLAPDRALPWLGGINLRVVWQLVLLIMTVQALGHVALRLFGGRLGLPLSGLAAGFVSSTATIATMGARAARHPELRSACVAGAWFSTVATSLQMMLIAGLLYPAGLRLIMPAMVAALLTTLLLGLAAFRRSSLPSDDTPLPGRAFSLRHSILLALLFMAIAAAVAWLQQAVGSQATLLAAALAGLADAHSSGAAVMGLAARNEIEPFTMLTAVLLAFSSNSLSKIVAAYATGGMRYGSIVGAGLVLVALAAWTGWAWVRVSA
jgi:uncharacterized membrane protein (DUF4010 family)